MIRTSRRRFVVGAGVGALGLGAVGAAQLRTRRRAPIRPAAVSISTPPGSSSITPAPLEPLPTPVPRGGTARLTAATRFAFDTFDSTRSGEPSVLEVLGRTHSRLLRWVPGSDVSTSPGGAQRRGLALGPDLALSWEQPDPLTFILRLDPRARWHDRPPVNGRAFFANDVVSHFQRVLSLAGTKPPLLQQASSYSSIRRITSPNRSTVVFQMGVPDAYLPNTLASSFALVQAPEAVEAFQASWHKHDSQSVVGTGPFMFMGQAGERLSFKARELGHRLALLDGLSVSSAASGIEEFERKRVDRVLTRDAREALALRLSTPLAAESFRYEDSPVISSFFVGAPPWNDKRLLVALSGALERTELSRRLFQGRADAASPVTPAFPGFLPVAFKPEGSVGYSGDFPGEDRAARLLWGAAGGPALGRIVIDFPSIFDPLYAASAVVVGMLNEVLGTDQFRAAVETYTTISAKVQAGKYGNGASAFWFGWGPPFAEPDPSRRLLDTYHSQSATARTAGFRSDAIDQLLDRLRAEPTLAGRGEIAGTVAGQVVSGAEGGTAHWLLQRSEVFSWPYLRIDPWTSLPDWSGDATLGFLRDAAAARDRPEQVEG